MRSATIGGENYTDSSNHLMISAYQELQDAVEIKRVNNELLDHLIATLRWILHYVKKHNMHLPETDKLLKPLEDKLPPSVYDDD